MMESGLLSSNILQKGCSTTTFLLEILLHVRIFIEYHAKKI